jgi:Tfp pilus assembly protein PilN
MRVNLILESERRSTSPVSLSVVIRTAAGVAILLVMMFVVSLISSYRALNNSVRYVDEEWKRTEPKYKAALQIRGDLEKTTATLKEIQSWRETRLAWGQQMEYLQQVVPPLVQLTEMRVTQDLLVLSNNIPARVFELRLSGRTGSLRSEANVSELREALAGRPPFNAFIESVSIPPGAFRQDPAVKSDRTFEIVCRYFPRPFK